ncbi:MAG: response regulator [Archangium sp.]|nr:response regulator [Archangium sp.]MDP3156656.1 response regulator [Archangium sp.]MDP3570597.1 response regulator [Archangium sp.]
MRLLTSHEVASLVQVSPSSVLKWIEQGKLRAFRTPGGHRRVASDELVDFLRAHRLPVPRELEGEKVRLLVIDDEPTYLRSLGALLAKSDFPIEVSLAENALDGLLKVGLLRPEVVLLDSYMPGMDGLEVCRRLKESPQTASIAVLAMSGRHSAELEKKFHEAGAAAFLRKPFQPAEVLSKLEVLGLVRPKPRSG